MAALLCLLVLLAVSGIPGNKKNGFNRQWLNITVRKHLSYELPFAAERLFGSGAHLYLSEPSHRQVYRLDSHLRVSDTIKLHVGKPLKPPVNFFADGNHLYIHEYNSATMFFADWHAATFNALRLSEGPFLKSLQLSDSLVVIRGFEPGSFKPVFMQINTRSGDRRHSDLLSEKADAGFSTDGILCSNAGRDRLLYIPYFENGIYCMDSNLSLRYQQHTIDTVFNSGIEVASQGDGDVQKLYATAPRVKVNKRAFADDRLLFIESDLRADNEDATTFRQQPVLDAYRIEDGSYAGSLHLPLDKRKVLSYYLHNGVLYVLLKDQLLSFSLALP
jgi:hypothetical protein